MKHVSVRSRRVVLSLRFLRASFVPALPMHPIGSPTRTWSSLSAASPFLPGSPVPKKLGQMTVRMPGLESWTCTAHSAAHKSFFRTPVWTADAGGSDGRGAVGAVPPRQ